MPVQLDLATLRERYARDALTTAPARSCGLHVIHADEISTAERGTLNTLARLRLDADGRPLSHHVEELVQWHDEALAARLEQADAALRAPAWTSVGPALQGDFDGARGGFRFRVSGPLRPARPWINVLANPLFGAQISEAGAGYTWAGNSRLHQLTSWSNDPVTDSSSEAFFVQDLRTREVWNLGARQRQRRGDVHGRARAGVDDDRAPTQRVSKSTRPGASIPRNRSNTFASSCTTSDLARSGSGWSVSSNG